MAWLFTEYEVAWGILKFQCKTWELLATSYLVNSQAIRYNNILPANQNQTSVLFAYAIFYQYRHDPKFSDRYASANSADPDQTADQGLHCLPFRLHLLDSLLYGRATLFELWDNYSNFWGVPNITHSRNGRKFIQSCCLLGLKEEQFNLPNFPRICLTS